MESFALPIDDNRDGGSLDPNQLNLFLKQNICTELRETDIYPYLKR